MKKAKDLLNLLNRINGNGYKGYKETEGEYDFGRYILSIDHVQGDPFAVPSRVRVIVNEKYGKFPENYFNKYYKRVAVVDFLTRLCTFNINKYYDKVKGSGKSGIFEIDSCDQQILDRTSIFINKERVEGRFQIGFPAAGRKILSQEAIKIFFEFLPNIVEKTLYFDNINGKDLKEHIELVEDQTYIRNKLNEMGICAFIANDSILPRENGISQKPLKNSVIKFKSPENLEIEISLPNRGIIKGMGIPKGITLIVGGGYHGKSTLLKALELGVYNHIKGDGREFVITDDSAVKVRAEDGRRIEKVDISMFINNIPNGEDTVKFSSDNASGSTSQAANIVEAIECGTKLLLIDEDTSATNFMIRDEMMQKLVKSSKEPITPFINRAGDLYKDEKISTILVLGSSGEYFNIADTVIMLDEYKILDVTKKAKQIIKDRKNYYQLNNKKVEIKFNRIVLKKSFKENYKEVKVKSLGMDGILYNKLEINLRFVEQLVNVSQVNAIGEILKYIKDRSIDEKLTLAENINKVYDIINREGLDIISYKRGILGNLALPRKYEIASALNRFRELSIK